MENKIKCAITGRDFKRPTVREINESRGMYYITESTYRRWKRELGLVHMIVWLHGDPSEHSDTDCTIYRGQKAIAIIPVRFALDV